MRTLLSLRIFKDFYENSKKNEFDYDEKLIVQHARKYYAFVTPSATKRYTTLATSFFASVFFGTLVRIFER